MGGRLDSEAEALVLLACLGTVLDLSERLSNRMEQEERRDREIESVRNLLRLAHSRMLKKVSPAGWADLLG